jgi:transposase
VPYHTTLLRWANLLQPETLHRLLDRVTQLARSLKVTRGHKLRIDCTRRQVEPKELVLQPRLEHEALQTARRHQQTEAFKVQYAARAGVEGTHEQAVRRSGLRRARYIGLNKTRLQHVATAAALNLVRISEWCAGSPLAKTRCSRFAALQ